MTDETSLQPAQLLLQDEADRYYSAGRAGRLARSQFGSLGVSRPSPDPSTERQITLLEIFADVALPVITRATINVSVRPPIDDFGIHGGFVSKTSQPGVKMPDFMSRWCPTGA